MTGTVGFGAHVCFQYFCMVNASISNITNITYGDDMAQPHKLTYTTSVKKVGILACSGCSGAAGTCRNTYFFYRWPYLHTEASCVRMPVPKTIFKFLCTHIGHTWSRK